MSHKDRILRELKPLIADAKALGKWLVTKDGYWLSPQELEQELERDHFLRGKDHWELRDPEDYLRQLEEKRDELNEKIREVKERLRGEG